MAAYDLRCCCLLPEHRHGAGGHNFEHAPAKTRQVSVRLLTNALHAHLLDHDIWPTNLETVHHFGDAAACFGLPSRLYNVLLSEALMPVPPGPAQPGSAPVFGRYALATI